MSAFSAAVLKFTVNSCHPKDRARESIVLKLYRRVADDAAMQMAYISDEPTAQRFTEKTRAPPGIEPGSPRPERGILPLDQGASSDGSKLCQAIVLFSEVQLAFI